MAPHLHDVARPHNDFVGDGLLIWRLAVNILNKNRGQLTSVGRPTASKEGL